METTQPHPFNSKQRIAQALHSLLMLVILILPLYWKGALIGVNCNFHFSKFFFVFKVERKGLPQKEKKSRKKEKDMSQLKQTGPYWLFYGPHRVTQARPT